MTKGMQPRRLNLAGRRAGGATVLAALFILGLLAALNAGGANARSGAAKHVSKAEAHAALRAELRRVANGSSSAAAMTRQHNSAARSLKQAWAAAPTALRNAKGDGIDLLSPANGSTWQWAPGGTLHFSWYNGWYCPGCSGVIVMIVFDSQGNHAYEGSGICPASSAPSCPTSVDVALNPGTYTWGVGVGLGTNPNHVSDIWSFQIVGGAPPPATTTAPPPPPPPPPTTTAPPPPTTTATTTTATTTAPSAPTTTATPPAPKCRVPNVKGMRLADAQIKLFKVNCALGTVTKVHSTVPKGRVAAQSPAPGGVFAADTKVRLMVSSGR